MKHIVFQLNNKKATKKAIKHSLKKRYKTTLVQLFIGTTKTKKIQKVLDDLVTKFPNATIIGASTAGEIYNATIYDNSTTISLSLFESTDIKVSYEKSIDKKAGKKLAKDIHAKDTKACIILSEGLVGKDYNAFLDGFKSVSKDVLVAGGLAGDNFNLKKTAVFLNSNIYNEGSVAISFSGENLYADNQYNLNFAPIGKEFTLTKVQGSHILEIDGVSAVTIFKNYLGKEIFNNNCELLSNFQLLYSEGNTIVARTPMTKDGDSIILAGAIKEGQKVQFGFSNADTIIAGASKISDIIQGKPAQAIYLYSCIARKKLLNNKLQCEIKKFDDIAPSAGFFTYGEYYSTNTNNVVLNCTTTLLILSESKQKSKNNLKRISTYNSNTRFDDLTFSALQHFIKQMTDELKQNMKLLNQYKTVVDSTLIVSKTDKQGFITYSNENFSKISGYSQEELLGKNHNIIRDPSVPKSVFKKMWSELQKGNIWQGKFPNKTKYNATYYVNATIMPTYDDSEHINGYIAIRQDITREVTAHNRLKEKEKLIKAIFDNQENIVIHSSKKSGMISVNKKFFTYFNYKNLREFKSKHSCICDLFLHETKEHYIHPQEDEDWLNTIADNEHIDYKVKMSTKSESIHTFNIKIKKIGDEFILNFSDITNLEKALEKANFLQHAKSIFLANMSHEIRTPLNGILGFADVLKTRKLDVESQRYVNIIQQSGQTLLNVVNDVLDSSKIDSGELSISLTKNNLFSELETTILTLASTAKSKNIDYHTYIDTKIPKFLQCDAQKIKQVLNNLIGNAIKFTPKKGTISIDITLMSVENEKATIHFSVKDSGIGIEKEKQKTIFLPFSQADESISREFGGTGLGLSISSQYTHMMGNKLKVKSKNMKGSEFYFDLELDIIENSQNFTDFSDTANLNIKLFHSKSSKICQINKNIAKYFNNWNISYEAITSTNGVDDKTDILIVCAKLFDRNRFRNALEEYEKLKVIYIEDGEDKFGCIHKHFFPIKQPMTGSSLFETIVSTTQNKIAPKTKELSTKMEQFRGKILIAEDNPTNQMLITILLESRGLEFLVVENGQEAIDEAMKNSYDIILMDINMPILDGINATKILREKEYKKPIVSLSANVMESDIKIFLDAGVDATLNKPIESDDLDNILKQYLKSQSDVAFDIIDLDKLCDTLKLPNKTIIIKLLNSYESSVIDMIQKIESDAISTDILHAIKGVSGNLRFKEIYEFCILFEDTFEQLSEDEKSQKSELLLLHLKKSVENINLLNKDNIIDT